jgi:hypothetical protein
MPVEQKTVEVDETQFLAMRNSVNRLAKVISNPKARKLVQDAEKLVFPDTVTPQDYQNEVLEEVNKTKDELAAIKKQMADDKAAADETKRISEFADKWAAQKKALVGSYTVEGISEIEKLATERGIPDLEAASALFDKLHPAEPVSGGNIGSGGWDLFEPATEGQETYINKLLQSRGEDEQAVNSEARKVLAEIRGQRAA